jgi:putative ABC transport system permease protein
MMRLVSWRYVLQEMRYRWRRSALLICGIAVAATLVVSLDMLGRAFVDVATVPFRDLGADLIVQRSATQSSVPKAMGVMLPYSAQPITADEFARLRAEPGVAQAAGFVLLWNFGVGKFYSLSGISLEPGAAALGPGRVVEWLIKGRLPTRGAKELLVERHYGAFFKLDPGATVEIGGTPFQVVGVVDLKQGSQIAASNFYLDIDLARDLIQAPPGLVNQVFLKVADMAETETAKNHVAGWLPHASVSTSGTMLQLFGGVSQTIGRFRIVAVGFGAAIALALSALLVYGALAERRLDLAVLRAVGWNSHQVRLQISAEMAIHGLIAGLVTVALAILAQGLLAHVNLPMPASLPGQNPVDFAAGALRAPTSMIALPATLTLLDWAAPAIVAALACLIWGWRWSADPKGRSLWAAIKAK